MNEAATQKQQNKGFNVLFLTEMWERFGFYTVASILVLYLTSGLGYGDKHAFTVFAVFTALLFITPMIGGYVADHVLGFKRSLIYGVVTLALGYAVLAIPGKFYIYLGLSLIITGQGFFKSMPYALLGKLFRDQNEKMDGRFTMYYLSINLGGIPAVIFAGTIAKLLGWNMAFAIAAVGLTIATITFCTFIKTFHNIGNEKDFQSVHPIKHILTVAGIIVSTILVTYLIDNSTLTDILTVITTLVTLGYLFYMSRSFTQAEKLRLIGALFLIVLGVVFFIFYYQQPTSLTLFVERNVDRHLFGWTIPASAFWTLNPIWILSLGPVLHYLYRKLGKHDPKITVKFSIGIITVSIGYFIIAWSTKFANQAGLVSAWWIVASYFFQSLAELLVSALGAAMVVKLVPKRVLGVVMGAWFFSSALSGIIAGKLAGFTAIPKGNHNAFYSLGVYHHAFMMFGYIALAIGAVACLSAPLLARLTHAEDAANDEILDEELAA